MNRETSYLLLSNLGDVDARLERRTPVADALVAQLGDTAVASAHTFDLPPPHSGAQLRSAQAETPAVDVDPLEMYERVEVPDAVSPTVEAATTVIDDVYKVGVDEHGQAPAPLVELLRRHSKRSLLTDDRVGSPDMRCRSTSSTIEPCILKLPDALARRSSGPWTRRSTNCCSGI
ncbi:hypothetical protein A4X13_0g6395 [Tilletia indica]|uniref:Uncharacterized protein n=1 Tax=Tilletia indica TaxID=43049 RepID=A0A177T538_9BASI|nr:hypothetical protein A4X13_0g6395 [Tilletia indica]